MVMGLSPSEQGGAEMGQNSILNLTRASIVLSLFPVSPHLIQLLLSKFAIASYFISVDTNPNPDPIKVSGRTSNNFS